MSTSTLARKVEGVRGSMVEATKLSTYFLRHQHILSPQVEVKERSSKVEWGLRTVETGPARLIGYHLVTTLSVVLNVPVLALITSALLPAFKLAQSKSLMQFMRDKTTSFIGQKKASAIFRDHLKLGYSKEKFGLNELKKWGWIGDWRLIYQIVFQVTGRSRWWPFTNPLVDLPFISRGVRHSRVAATSHEALWRGCYNLEAEMQKTNPIDRFFLWLWPWQSEITTATANRRYIVAHELSNGLENLLFKKGLPSIRVLSAASGSGIAVWDALRLLADRVGPEVLDRIEIYMADTNPGAIDSAHSYQRSLIGDKYGREWDQEKYAIKEAGVSKALRKLRDQNLEIHAIEVNGLLDYYTVKAVEDFAKLVYANLHQEGFIIVSNITKNPELYFFKHCMRWVMIPKNLVQFISLFVGRDKFALKNIIHLKDYYFNVYSILMCWKSDLRE